MATSAIVLLTFDSQLSVTIKDDNTWSLSGDPGGLLTVEGGTWKSTPPTGTELIAEDRTQVVLVSWYLKTMAAGTTVQGDAFLFPETSNAYGKFDVTKAF